MSRAALICAALLFLSVPGAIGQEATIRLDASHRLAPVNRHVLGQNVEAGDPYHIFSAVHDYAVGRTGDGIWVPETQRPVPETVEFARQIGLSALRWPGGCLTHRFNRKDAAFPCR